MSPHKLHHHAYLYVGGDSETKIEQANQVAADLLVSSKTSAHLWEAGNHPDYFFISPEEKSHSIKVDQIRELIGKLQQKPQHAVHQVAVIFPAETMTIGAANALLKTLEEPSGDTILILISNQPQRLLPTIRSRCQLMRFTHKDAEKADPVFQSLYKTCEAQLIALQKRETDPITVAEALSKQDIKQTLSALYRAIVTLARKQDPLSQRSSFYYLDSLVEAKRYADNSTAINARLLLENLLLKWGVQ